MTQASEVRTPQTDGTAATDGNVTARVLGSLKWWPTLAGVGFAAFVAMDMFRGAEQGSDLASIVAASGLVYLAAAALQKPAFAWPAFFVSVVVITAAKLGLTGFDATWALESERAAVTLLSGLPFALP